MMISVTVGTGFNRTQDLVDTSATLRSVLEKNNVNINVGTVALNGKTLQPHQLDETFDSMGIAADCFLISSVKADNAAKAQVAGGSLVIISSATPDELATLAKYRPDALFLTRGEGANKEKYFGVSVVDKGYGSISARGAAFSKVASNDGKATITIAIPEGTDKPKDWAEEYLGVSILNLSKVEEQFAAALEEVKNEKAKVAAAITMA